MSLPIELSPRADQDIEDAKEWYERRRTGWGEVFVLAVDDAFERIRRFPHSAPEAHPGVRGMLLKKFPFSVLYTVEVDRIVVHAVYHGKRDPDRWQSRR